MGSVAGMVDRRPSPALASLQDEIVACRACPRLVAWREQVAVDKRAAFADDDYWGRPVPGFGDPAARLLVVGLAPAAHGANRTGRMFTGDRSGDFLFAGLWRAGFANQPSSVDRQDGLVLHGAWITAPVRCAPPANKPTPAETRSCAPFLARELALLPDVRAVLALGAFGYQAVASWYDVRPRPRFTHGLEVPVDGGPTIVCSFHVSQQNTFTGRLTPEMFDDVLRQVRHQTG